MKIDKQVLECVVKVLPVALKTSLWFLKIMLPVSLGMTLLSFFDILSYLSAFAAPAFGLLGLPGDAALVFITSIFTNIYTVIALMSNLDFSLREGIILAMMCLISHNYLVETLVQKKTGSSAVVMVGLRLVCSFIAALALNWVLPSFATRMAHQQVIAMGLTDTLLNWLQSSLLLSLKVVAIISVLMIVQRLLEVLGILRWLSSLLFPVMDLFGLPRQVAFLWLVGNTLGLAYGSAVLMDYASQGKVTQQEADSLNYHLAISHSQLEDPLLFAVLGLPIVWLIIPRMVLALLVVWMKRLWEMAYGRYEQVGVG